MEFETIFNIVGAGIIVNNVFNYAKEYTLEEINCIIGGIINQLDNNIIIKRISSPNLADENTLAIAINEKELENLSKTRAKAAIVPLGVGLENISTIEAERPRLALMKLLHLFYIPPDSSPGIHPSSVIDPDAKIGKDVCIGPNVVISRGTIIGDNTKILANTYIGKFANIGNNCLFHPGVCIGDFVQIGNHVILHHGVSIGADGFSFVTEDPGNIEIARQEGKVEGDFSNQKIHKIPSVGSVTVCDDVEIGANSCIDRGNIENTFIGKGTKIDNLVQIGHNCKIGENCLIVSQVGISGSVNIGDRVVLAGQVGIADHISIGNDSIAMAKAGITKSFPSKSIVGGTPAAPRKEFVKSIKATKDIDALKKKVNLLEKGLELLKQGIEK